MAKRKQKVIAAALRRHRPRPATLPQPPVHGVASFEWNMRTGITRFSEEWERMTLCRYNAELPNNSEWWLARLHPEDVEELHKAAQALCSGFVDKNEVYYRLKRGDGVWRRFLARSRVRSRSADGTPLVASGITVDVSDLLGVDERPGLPGSLSGFDFHSMLENSPDLFIRFERDLVPVYVNPIVSRYFGVLGDAAECPAMLMRNCLEGDSKELFQRHVERVFAEKSVVRAEISLPTIDGGGVVGECAFWPEFDRRGNVQYAMVQFRDLSEQRRMEERLRLNELRLGALYRLTCMENAPESEVIRYVLESMLRLTDSRSGFFFIPEEEGSDKGCLLWSEDHYDNLDPRYLPDDHLPQDLIVQMTDNDGNRVYRGLKNPDKDGEPLHVVFDGQMRVLRGIMAPCMEGNRMVCVAGVCNKESDYEESDLQQFETFINSAWLILRRRRSVIELEKAKSAAESANRAKDAFLANVSHELRTPLNGVLSMLQLIDDLPLGMAQRDYLRTAQESGRALLRIISDLLDFSCMESGKMPLSIEAFDPAAGILSALEMFDEDAAQRGLDYCYSIDPQIPPCLLGDEARLRQILFNIVGNALKFTHKGGIRVECAAIPAPVRNRAGIRVTVEDTGIGIPREKLAGIFDAFKQMDGSHRVKYGGTGLGLGIVKHLASMMGGSVEMLSEEGQGARVTCRLFFDLPGETFRQNPTEHTPPGTLPGGPLDILVAEDDEVGRLAIRAFLTRMGHNVFCVEDGVQALQALQAHRFHCLLTDITMPNMDGLELARRIRTGNMEELPADGGLRARVRERFSPGAQGEESIDPGMVIAAVSAHSMIGDKERFLGQGMDFYVSKPIDKRELAETLYAIARRLREGEEKKR